MAVDVMVVEVGLLGRWDATNVVDAEVAVVTNVGLDHTDLPGRLGPTSPRRRRASSKPDSILVLGETDPELAAIFPAESAGHRWERRATTSTASRTSSPSGAACSTLRTPCGTYPEVFLPLHGAHQGDNAAAALAAVEAFFDRPLDADVVSEALRRGHRAGPLRGAAPPAAGDPRRRPQPRRRRGTLRRRAGRGVRSPSASRMLVVGLLPAATRWPCSRRCGPTASAGASCCTPPSPRAVPADGPGRRGPGGRRRRGRGGARRRRPPATAAVDRRRRRRRSCSSPARSTWSAPARRWSSTLT